MQSLRKANILLGGEREKWEDPNEVITLEPKVIRVNFNRYHLQGRNEEAIDCYNRIILLSPNNVLAYFGKGIAYLDMKQREKAIECFDEAIRMYPNFTNVHYTKGQTLKLMGKTKEAMECFDKAVSLDENCYEALQYKALALTF